MQGSQAVRDEDLDAQLIELLPSRETLWSINVVNVVGVNIALSINAASFQASAAAIASQQLSAWKL